MKMHSKLIKTAFLLGLVGLFVSCNNKHEGEDLLSISNNREALNQRVTIYERPSSQPMQAKGVSKAMPEAPNVETITYDYVLDGSFKAWAPVAGKSYFLPAGQVQTISSLKMDNNTYYIAGTLNLNGVYNTVGATFIILPEGTLNFPVKMEKGMKIYNYGTFGTPSDYQTLQGSELYSNVPLTFGSLKMEGYMYMNELLTCNSLHLVSSSTLEADNCLVITGTLDIDNNSTAKVNHYLSVGELLLLRSGGTLEVNSACLVDAKTLDMRNDNCRVIVNGDEFSVFNIAETTIIRQNNTKNMFSGWIDLHSAIDNRSGVELDWLSTVRFYGDTYIQGADCRPEFGEKPSAGEKEYLIDHIAEVAPPKSNLSATSIQFMNDNIYVSYHVQGSPYSGAVDVFNLSLRELRSNFESDKIDFNHLIVEPSQIILAGASAKDGGLIATIPIQNGTFSQAILNKYDMSGSNATCIIRNGNYYIASSNAGFRTLEASNMNVVSSKEVAYAKHLNLNNDKFVAVSGTDDAQVNVYNATDISMENPISTFQAGAINPTNGKNVCKLDGNRIYLCKGHNGLVIFEDGVQIWESTGIIVNGVDVDENYIYIAGGPNGFLILDKTTYEVIASYTHTSASANYVSALSDGYVYVAYGLRGAQLFRLIETTK